MSLEVWTHRGINLGPEQTLPAYEEAILLGIGIEADVRSIPCQQRVILPMYEDPRITLHRLEAGELTQEVWLGNIHRQPKKHELVLFHDDTVDRTTNGKGPLSDYTFEELRQLDAGAWYGEEYTGTRVPTLDELLVEVKRSGVPLDLDLKDRGVGLQALAAVRRHGVLEQTIFSAFDVTIPQAIKRAESSARVGHLVMDVLPRNLRTIKESGMDFVAPYAGEVTPKLIETAHKLGLDVVAWYDITDELNRGNVPDYPVDGIIDNHPPSLLTILQELGKVPRMIPKPRSRVRKPDLLLASR